MKQITKGHVSTSQNLFIGFAIGFISCRGIILKNIFRNKFIHIKGEPIIQIISTREILAEGCGEVKLYDENQVIFKAKRKILIEGEKLTMTNLESGAVLINGKISIIKFED